MMAAKCGADTITACEVREENLEIFFKSSAYTERSYLGFQTNGELRCKNNTGEWL